MARAYQHKTTSVFLLNYHIVWCPKYRKKVLVGKIRNELIQHLNDKCELMGWEVIALEVMPDHLHIFVGANPSTPVDVIVQNLKGYTSFKLRAAFPHLKRMRSLWTRSYFVSTAGNVSSQMVEWYIAEQRSK
jgi:putative transposase